MRDVPMFTDTPTRRKITFSEASLRLIDEDLKTQTRRLAVRVPRLDRRTGEWSRRQDSIWTRARAGDVLVAARSPYLPPRFALPLVAVRREPLHDITPADCRLEGIRLLAVSGRAVWTADPDDRDLCAGDPVGAYRALWDRLHGRGAWDRNPEVVVLTFERHRHVQAHGGTRP